MKKTPDFDAAAYFLASTARVALMAPMARVARGMDDATPPLQRDLEVTGPVTLRLWIASDAPDTDFTAKLIDVYPPSADFPQGFAMNLTEGLLRVGYRDGGSGRRRWCRARSMRSPSSCSRSPSCSAVGTA